MSELKLVLGGKATVHCPHDRIKRQITTEEQVTQLGLALPTPVLFQKGIHKIHRCSCCENLFVEDGVTERYCSVCSGPLAHPLGGPLPDPEGVVA